MFINCVFKKRISFLLIAVILTHVPIVLSQKQIPPQGKSIISNMVPSIDTNNEVNDPFKEYNT